jgi:hypothetical protein
METGRSGDGRTGIEQEFWMARPGKAFVFALAGLCGGLMISAGAGLTQTSGHGGKPPVAKETAPNQIGYAARFMQLFDTNNDGKVTADEIAADQARLFKALDVDGNGTLSVEEVARRGYVLQIWRVTTMFDLMDVNGDRELTVEEISAPMKRWFGRYDLNKDGAMDSAEVPVRSQRGAGRRTER